MPLLEFLERINPYLPIAFLLVCLCILCKLYSSYHTAIKYAEYIKSHFMYIISKGHYQHCAINILKYEFMIILLLLEVAINLIGSVGWIIVNTQSHDLPKSLNISESCQISDNKNLIALGRREVWFLSLLTRLVEIISLHLLPMICCALDVIRCEYLSHPYKGKIKYWKLYIVLSSVILLILCNILWTFVIFYVLQTVLHLLNLSMYVIYSKRFYECIRQTQKETHSQSNPETKRTKQELQKCTSIKREFLVTSIYTFILFFVIILQVTCNAVILVVSTFVMNNCYFSVITFGYIPIFNFDSATLHFISECREKGYIFTFALSYLHQFMMLIAYIVVFLKLSCCQFCTGKKNKKMQESIKSMIQETYKYRRY